jgi:hypothetical protein
MGQTCIETTSRSTARPGLAWFSSAIPEVIWPAGRVGLPAETPQYPSNPIFGRARPIMGQQPNAAAAASVNSSLTGAVNPSFRTARTPKAAWAQPPHQALTVGYREPTTRRSSHGGSQAAADRATGSALRRKNPGLGHRRGVVTRRHINAFFAISVNSPSMSMVNFSCCVCSAQKPCARGVTRRVTPQPTRAALRMEAGAHVCV